MAVAKKVVFIGNPGVGKSTLLNCLLGKSAFKSGINIATGISYQLQQITDETNGVTYCDTPGLKDVAMREKAAVAITKALKQGGEFLVAFTVTLESGRVKPEDVSTIEAVLGAAPEIRDFGLVINKLSKNLHNRLSTNVSQKQSIINEITKSLSCNQPSVLLLQNNSNLEGEENAHENLPALSDFVFRIMKPVVINTQNVKNVNAGRQYDIAYQREMAAIAAQMEAERQEAKRLQRAREEEARRQARQRQEAEDRRRRQEAERQQREREYEAQRRREQERIRRENEAREAEERERQRRKRQEEREREAARQQQERERQEREAQYARQQAAARARNDDDDDDCVIL